MKLKILTLTILLHLNLNGQTLKEEIPLDNINSLEISNFSEVNFVQSSNKNNAYIEYGVALNGMIRKEITKSNLHVEIVYPKNLNLKKDKKILEAKSKIIVYGDFNLLRALKTRLANKVKLNINSNLSPNMHFINCGKIEGKLISSKLKIEVTGSNMKILGICDSLDLISKSSNFDSYKLNCKYINLISSGSNLKINASNNIDVNELNRSTLNYKGVADLNINSEANTKQSSFSKIN